MVELDRPERRIKYGAKRMRFSRSITKTSIHTHARTHTLITFNTYRFIID